MTTQAQILLAVRERLDEATAGEWSDAELRRWINQGANDIARRTETLHTVVTSATIVGDSTYTAPADTIRISRVEWTPNNTDNIYPLEYRDFNAMDPIWWTNQASTSSNPQYWTTSGFPPSLTIRLYPVPSSTGFINVFYYRYPTQLATDGSDANDTVELPTGWDDIVVDYVEYTALRKDRDPRWQEAKQLYEQHVDEVFALSRRWTDQPGIITPDTPNVPAWLWME